MKPVPNVTDTVIGLVAVDTPTLVVNAMKTDLSPIKERVNMAILESRLEKMKEFSEYIRQMRLSVHWSSAELAKRVGMEKARMSHYEREYVYPRNADELRRRIQQAVAAEHRRIRQSKTLH